MTSTPEELRGQVAEARERLGATVEELAAKADVKSRAQHKVAEVKDHMRHTAEQMRGGAAHAAHRVQERSQEQLHTATTKAAQTGRHPVPLAVTGGLLALAVGLAVRGRRGMEQISGPRMRAYGRRATRAYRRTARVYGRTARAHGRRARAQAARAYRGRGPVAHGRVHARGRRH